MSQQNIDFGSFPNDPSADAIRVAFQKVQNNFTQLFTGLESQTVLSVNQTPGQGITVNNPTGNVVVSANIANVKVSSNTLAIGISAAATQPPVTQVYTSWSQNLIIELPNNLANISNISVSGNITSNNLTVNNSISTGNLSVTNNFTAGNVFANSGTIGASLLTGTLTTAAQPNITSVGTLGSLTVTGNISGANLTGNHYGNGSGLSGIVGSNVTGTVANATYATSAGSTTTAGTVTTNAQPNITSVGTLTNLSVTGNVTAGNLKGDGGNISNIAGANVSGTVANANYSTYSGTAATANSVAGANVTGWVPNANIANFDVTSLQSSGNAYLKFGNATSGNTSTTSNAVFVANTSNGTLYATTFAGNIQGSGNSNVGNIGAAAGVFTTVAGNLTTAAQPNITSVGTLTSLAVTGNITSGNANLGNAVTANYFIGSGNNLSNVQGANVTGTVANATYAVSAGSAGSATTAGTVTTNAQPNITSVGTLTSLGVSGTITAANITANTGVFTGNGANLTNLTGANVTGQVGYANVANNVAGGNVSGQVGNSLIAGTVYTNAQPNITSVGTLTSLGVSGTVTAANITANTGVFTGNANGLSSLQGANLVGTINSTTLGNSTLYVGTTAISLARASASQSLTGITSIDGYASTVSTNAQPNITSVGTLSSLAVTANITSGNVYANSGTIGANLLTGTLTTNAQPNITSVGTLTSVTATGNVIAGNVYSNSGIIQAEYLKGDGSNISNISIAAGSYIINGTSNASLDPSGNFNVKVAGTANVLQVTNSGAIITGTANVSSDLTAGNVISNNVTANNFTGNIVTANQANITNVGTLTQLNVSGLSNLGPVSNVTITGGGANYFLMTNGSGGLTWNNATLIPVAGSNTQVAYNNAGSFGASAAFTFNQSSNLLTVNGNGNFGNLLASQINASANVTAPVFISNVANGTAPLVINSQSRIANLNADYVDGYQTDLGANANTITIRDSNASITANIFYGKFPGANVTGTVANANYSIYSGTVVTNAQPNITSVGTLSSLAVTANITSGNVYANSGIIGAAHFVGEAGNLSNIQGGNVSGAVTYATTANNVAGGNVTGAVASASALLSNTSSATTAYPTFVTSSSNGYSENYINSSLSANLANGALIATTFAGNATTAGTVTTNAQPNITSVGTLTSLTVTGKVSAGQLQGDGGNISNVQGGNVSGAVTYATTANSVAGGNVSGAVAYATTANSVAGANVSGAVAYATTANAVAGANVSGTVASANNSSYLGGVAAASYLQVTGTGSSLTAINGANVTGTVANATYATSAGSATSATSATTAGTVTTAAQPNITSVGTLSSLAVTGNISGSNIIANSGGAHYGSGSGLTSIPGANITGTINSTTLGNSTVYIGTTGIALNRASASQSLTGIASIDGYASTVSTNAQPNITSVGTLTSLNSSGNITGPSVIANTGYFVPSVTTNISAAGTVQSNATAITSQINVVSTVASGSGVVFPTPTAGIRITIINTSANALAVYPAVNGQINNLGANVAYSLAAGDRLDFQSVTTTQWYTLNATYG